MASFPSAGAPLLEVRGLKVAYRNRGKGELAAVSGIDFSIKQGEIVGVLGESGCGKTSIGLALLRCLPPVGDQTGKVLFQGRDLAALSDREMRNIRGAQLSMIFQDPALTLSPLMRVGDQITEVLRAHRVLDRKQCQSIVHALLEDLELGDLDRIYRSFPHQLSGGQCQRILIAQALVCKPALIIADEPTASLDARTALEIIDLIRKINQRDGISFLFVSHDPAVLRALAHTVIVMYAGRIVERGTADQILTHPSHPYTRALLAARQGDVCENEFAPAEIFSTLSSPEA
jgi:ABC-type glutathione transport system ATPase component